MKVKKLVVAYAFEFDLVGISSSAKGFKLAWALNKHLNIRLTMGADLSLNFGGGKKITITNYIFETEHSIFRLFKNKGVDAPVSRRGYMVPEMPHFDYFATIKGAVHLYDTAGLIGEIRKIDAIEYVTPIDINKLKSKENFLF